MQAPRDSVRLFLCGDVMTERGIDQILPQPCDPQLYENAMSSAVDYVRLAEAAHGAIVRPVPLSYIWGEALDELHARRPDACIINLETSITRSDDFVPKGINYRMSPENAECLLVAGVDCCVLANNHVLDWGEAGLIDTLATLEHLKIKPAGAGRNRADAQAPGVLDLGERGRVLVFSLASVSSGTPYDWAAHIDRPGVNLLRDLSDETAAQVAAAITHIATPDDVLVVSIHWGANWGYEITSDQRRFAHALIDKANISIVHGHSSHHAKAIEIYRNRVILYGCGDFLNDYEGIRGYEAFRDDLALMYFADIDRMSKDLVGIEMVGLQIRHLHLERPSRADVLWLGETLARESRGFATMIEVGVDGRLVAKAQQGSLA